MRRRPPGSTPFPYTTLFRSAGSAVEHRHGELGDRLRVLLQGRVEGLDLLGALDLPQFLRARPGGGGGRGRRGRGVDRKSTRLNSSHANISYAVFCLKKKIAD